MNEQKPSEKIQEILNSDKCFKSGGDVEFALRLIYAIADFLDEEWEKKQQQIMFDELENLPFPTSRHDFEH